MASAPRVHARPRHPLRLRSYLAALLVLFVVAAAAAVVYVRFQSRRDARSAALVDAAYAADSAARLVADGANTLEDSLSGLAGDPALTQVVNHPSQCALAYTKVGAFPRGHIDILRPDGSVACSSLGPQGTDHSYRSQSWLSGVGPRAMVKAPVNDPVTDQPAAVFAIGFPGGIVAGVVELRPVGPDLAIQFGGARHLAFLVTARGSSRVLAESVDATRWVGASIANTPFARGAGSPERPDLEGHPSLFADVPVPGLRWTVYAAADGTAALANAGHLYDQELGLILGSLVVLLAAVVVVERRISGPIRRLAGAVRGGLTGAGPASIVLQGPAEVVALGSDVEGLVNTVRTELSQRTRAEDAARAAGTEAAATAEAYRVLFESHPEPMWIYDEATLEIFEVNEAAQVHYGYSREQFLSMTIEALRPPEDVAALRHSVATAGSADHSGPWRHVLSDGTPILVDISSRIVEFRGRHGRLVMATDVTARERLRAELSQSQRLESLGQLAGGIAHDFNNLLAVIINYSAFLVDELGRAAGEPGGERWEAVRADAVQIDRAAQRGARLTHQLLAFARREVVNPTVVCLNDVVAETEELLRRSLGTHVELDCRLGPDLRAVLVDPGQLEQVLVNLAVNARDAMPDGGRLVVETANLDVDASYATARPGIVPGPYVRLRVSDTGSGMPDEVIERAFEPFFTTKPKGQGTGLGLATIYGIINQAGGQVHLYSEPGLGTTCSVLLPVTDHSVPAPAARSARASPGGDEVILVVEDEEAIREVAQRILANHGYTAIVASSGDQAVALAGGHPGPIHLLVTDVVMPQMMGRDVAERVRGLRPAVKVMYMSGYARPLLGTPDRLPPDTVLLEKPFSEDELLRRVREALADDR